MSETATLAAAEPAKLLYTARTHTTGGRQKGSARSSDGRLDVQLSPPGAPGNGTNPEQLLAAGWSACFESAIMIAAHRAKIALPREFAIDAEVDLKQGSDGYFLSARLNIFLPGIDHAVAETLVETAHGLCPYSKALLGRIDVTTTVA